MTDQRTDYISWDDYFMGVAMLSAMRSKDPSSQVGSCIVNKDNRIVGIGYNGAPRGFPDDQFPWAREGELIETKYPFVVHSEANAILNSTGSLEGCRIYVALIPCNECAKLIAQSGIKEVIMMSDKHKGLDAFKATPITFKHAGVKMRLYEPTNDRLIVDFNRIKN